MLVQYVNGMAVPPLGRICAPRLYVAYALHLREAGLDGIIEHTVAFGVVVALVAIILHVPVVVLITYFYIGDVEGLWVSVLSTHLAIMTGNRSVGILQGTQALVNPRLQAV